MNNGPMRIGENLFCVQWRRVAGRSWRRAQPVRSPSYSQLMQPPSLLTSRARATSRLRDFRSTIQKFCFSSLKEIVSRDFVEVGFSSNYFAWWSLYRGIPRPIYIFPLFSGRYTRKLISKLNNFEKSRNLARLIQRDQ